MINVRFLTLAEAEVENVVSWYRRQTEDQSLTFLTELDRAVRLIAAFPLIATEIEPDIRRCLIHRFPYALIYGIEGDTIVVIAVAHLHRQPRYWANRLKSENK